MALIVKSSILLLACLAPLSETGTTEPSDSPQVIPPSATPKLTRPSAAPQAISPGIASHRTDRVRPIIADPMAKDSASQDSLRTTFAFPIVRIRTSWSLIYDPETRTYVCVQTDDRPQPPPRPVPTLSSSTVDPLTEVLQRSAVRQGRKE